MVSERVCGRVIMYSAFFDGAGDKIATLVYGDLARDVKKAIGTHALRLQHKCQFRSVKENM